MNPERTIRRAATRLRVRRSAVGVRGGLGGSGAPAFQRKGKVTVRFAGELGCGAVTGESFSEIGTEQRGAQAGDEEASIVAFELAEQSVGAGQQDADAIDLGEHVVEGDLDRCGVGAVGSGGLVVEGELEVKVGDSGDGGATRDAAVDIGAMQPRAVERLGDLSAGGVNDGGERCRHSVQCAFACNRSVVGQPSFAHEVTVPCTAVCCRVD